MSTHGRSGPGRRGLDRSGSSRGENWGDTLVKVGVITVGVWNIGGYPVDGKDQKMERIFQVTDKFGFDVIGLPENNVHWKQIGAEDQLRERVRGWFDYQKINIAYFEEYEAAKPYQAGGVSQWATNQMVHRISEVGQDGTGLGRWTWQVFRGKEGRRLRVITAYHPVYSESTDGTTWSQQKAFFDRNEVAGDPREIFTRDLQLAVSAWVDAGEQVILGIDANEDVQMGTFARKMREAGLKELTTFRHGRNGPPTFQLGRVPRWPFRYRRFTM
jgi:hypothetical protein